MSEKEKLRPVKYFGNNEGWFHCWTTETDIAGTKKKAALIETKNGRMITAWAEGIQFLDRKEKHEREDG